MTFDELNTGDTEVARAALLRCCGSARWADAILAQRPFAGPEGLLEAVGSVWWSLDRSDWLEAFSAHPRIGRKEHENARTSQWSKKEQQGVETAVADVRERLANGNLEYERRFGWIFLVNATGKSAEEMLELLESRLKNEETEEIRIAAGEQAKITRLRLNKLFDE